MLSKELLKRLKKLLPRLNPNRIDHVEKLLTKFKQEKEIQSFKVIGYEVYSNGLVSDITFKDTVYRATFYYENNKFNRMKLINTEEPEERGEYLEEELKEVEN